MCYMSASVLVNVCACERVSFYVTEYDTSIQIYICTSINILHKYLYTYIHVYIYICVCICIYMSIYNRKYVFMQI